MTQQRIYRSTLSGSGYALVATITSNTTSTYVDTGLTTGTMYYYVVRSFNGFDESLNSNESGAIPINDGAPIAPSGLSAADVPGDNGRQVSLAWSLSPSVGVTEQRIYRSATSGSGFTLVGTVAANVTAHTDSTLPSDGTWYYVVTAFDGVDESLGSNEALVVSVDNIAPVAPTGLTAADVPADNGGAIALSWTPSTSLDVIEQRIYRSSSAGGTNVLAGTVGDGVAGAFTDATTVDGVTYYYKVVAFDGANQSSLSATATAQSLDNIAPAIPTGLSAADTPNDNGGSITLTWTATTSTDATAQRIYRATTSGGPYTLVGSATGSATTFADITAVTGTLYYYVVTAFDGTYESGSSAEATATAVDNLPPSPPSTVSASDTPADNGGSITLTWSVSGSAGVLEQRVYRSTVTGGAYTLVATIPGNVTNTWNDTSVTDGTPYYYVMTTWDGLFQSAYSIETTATSANDLPPTSPTGLSVSDVPADQGGALDLVWTVSTAADTTEQRIFRSTISGTNYTLVATIADNVTFTWRDTAANAGVTFYYVVTAFDGVNLSPNSAEASGTSLDNVPPASPTLPTAVDTPADQGGSVDLNWTPSTSTDVTEQRVWRSFFSGGPYSRVATLPGNTATGWTDANTNDGTWYFYVIRAFDGTTESASSTEVSIRSVDNIVPAPPTALAAADVASDNGGNIVLNWTASADTDVTEQRLYRSTISGGGYALAGIVAGNVVTTYTDATAVNGTPYFYVIRAFDGTGESVNSIEATATAIDNLAPSAPTGVAAADTPADTGGSVTVTWTASASLDVTEYRVYRSTVSGSGYALLGTAIGGATTYVDATAITGTPYYYVVTAFDGTFESVNSTEATGTALSDGRPQAPTTLLAADTPADNGGAITLTWTPSVSASAVGQRVYRSTVSGGTYTQIAVIADNTTATYNDTGLTTGIAYYYVVRAWDGTQESVNSTESGATPLDNNAPLTPTGLAAADTAADQGGAITLTWTVSTSLDVVAQRVYRATALAGPYNLVTEIPGSATATYADTGLSTGTPYWYVVRAFDGTNESADSNIATATPLDNLAPAAPNSLAAADTVGDQGGSISLAWVPSTDSDVSEQRIYRSTTTGTGYVLLTTIAGNVTGSFADATATNGITYFYVVRAFDGTNESPDSTEASAASVDDTAPAAPTATFAADTAGDNGGGITLSWTPSVSTDVIEQRVYRSTTSGGGYILAGTVAGNVTATFADTGLTNLTTYYYVVRAFDGTSESVSSVETSAIPVDNGAPLAPTALSAADVAGDNGGAISLSWMPSTSIDVIEQRIYRSTTSGGPYIETAVLPGNLDATYIDTPVTTGTIYYYVVKSFDGTSLSPASNQASAVAINDLPPTPPTGLTAADVAADNGGNILLSWTPSVSTDVTVQRIYRGTSTGMYDVTPIASLAGNLATTWTDSTATTGTVFYYVVRAFDGTWESVDSVEASATALDNLTPAAPTGLTAADTPLDNGGSIGLAWTVSTSVDVTEQRIYRSATSGTGFVLTATVGAAAASWNDTTVTRGQTFFYAVAAFDGTSESPLSVEATATSVDNLIPVIPTGLTVVDTPGDNGGSLSLNWTPSTSPDVTEQRIKRSTSPGGFYTQVQVIAGNATATWTDTGLINGVTYYYVIEAFDGLSVSGNSAEAFAAPVDNVAAVAPTALTAADVAGDNGGAIRLNWTPSISAGVTEQRVYRSVVSGSGYVLVGTIPGNVTTTWDDTTVAKSVTYFYVIRAVDGGGESLNSVEATATAIDNITPAAPTGVAAADTPTDNGGSITLNWILSTDVDVTEQRIYRSATSGSGYVLTGTVGSAVTTFADTGLTNGTAYFYVVTAFDGANESANSLEATATPADNLAPVAPTALGAGDTPLDEGGSITLTWTPSVDAGVTEQRMYRSTTSGSGYVLIGSIPNNTLSTWNDTTATNGTPYYYVVRAWDGLFESANSTQASATAVDNLAPSAPTVLTAIDTPSDNGGSITLNWGLSTSPDVTGQRVYRATASGGPYSQIGVIADAVTAAWADTTAVTGTTYFYRVRAFDGTNLSAQSNEASAVALDNNPPLAPTVVSAADTAADNGGGITLNWTPSVSPGVTQQRVYRSITSGGGYVLVTTFADNTTATFADTGLTNGTTYYYVVRSFDGTTESPASLEVSAIPADNLSPAAPTGPTAVDTPADAGGSITLAWIPSASGDVVEQRVLRATVSGGAYTQVAVLSAAAAGYTDTGLTDGTTYYYVIRAWDGVFESANSTEVFAAPINNGAPIAPTVLTVSDTLADQGTGLTLTWTVSTSGGVTEQRIYRSTTSGTGYALVGTIADNVTAIFTDTGLVPGVTYFYVLTAYDGGGLLESAYSIEASAAPVDNLPPVAPTALSAVDVAGDQGGSVLLGWTPSVDADAVEQRIYRSATSGSGYALVSTIADNVTGTWTDTAATTGIIYYYVVRAFDGTSESVNSLEASAASADNLAPVAPTALSAADVGADNGGAIALAWAPSVSTDVIEQRVLRGTATGGPYTQVATVATAATGWIDTTAVTGTAYFYVVRAFDGTFPSANSTEATATAVDNLAPAAPATLTVADTPGDDGTRLTLSWTPSSSPDVTQQRVFRAPISGGTYTQVGTIADNLISTYTDTGLTVGTTYYYVVRAFDGTFESASSNEAGATTVDNLPPTAPTALSASDVAADNGGAIALAWTPSASGGATQQRLYRSTVSGSGYALITTFANNTTAAFTDTTAVTGTVYYYVVRAFDGAVESASSNEAVATALDNLAPAAPTATAAADVPLDNGNALTVTWTPSVSADAVEQRVYRSTTSGSGYTQVGTIAGNVTGTFTDTGLTKGIAYYYVVRAFDGSNLSANSPEATAVTVDNVLPSAPTAPAATDTPSDNGSSITLTWTVSTSIDVTQQRIYRSTISGSGYVLVGSIFDNTTSTWADTTVTDGTAYYYVLRVFDGAAESANSAEVTAIPADNIAPVTPTALAASDTPADAGGSIDLTWTPSASGDVIQQRIYRSTISGSGYTLMGTVFDAVTGAWTDTTAVTGTTYYYVVRAWDGTFESFNSNEASAPAVDNLTAITGQTGIAYVLQADAYAETVTRGQSFSVRFAVRDQQGNPVSGLLAADFGTPSLVNLVSGLALTNTVDYTVTWIGERLEADGVYDMTVALAAGAPVLPGNPVQVNGALSGLLITDNQVLTGAAAVMVEQPAPAGAFRWMAVQPAAVNIAADATSFSAGVRFFDNGMALTDDGALGAWSVTGWTDSAGSAQPAPVVTGTWNAATSQYDLSITGLTAMTQGNRQYVSLAYTVPGTVTRTASFSLITTAAGSPAGNQVNPYWGDPRLYVAPNPSITGPAGVLETVQATFTGGPGSPSDGISAYEWDVDYNGTFVPDYLGQVANHTWGVGTSGVHKVAFRVTDNRGFVALVTKSVAVSTTSVGGNAMPQVSLSATPPAVVGTPFNLSATAIDPDGAITAYEWDFNYDGSTFVAEPGYGNPTAAFTFATAGAFTVAVRVADNGGDVAMATLPVTVEWGPPTAVPIADAVFVAAGVTVNLDGSTSTSADGVSPLASYEWDYDYNGIAFTVDAAGATAATSYAPIGFHTIALRVTDGAGKSAIATTDVVVTGGGAAGKVHLFNVHVDYSGVVIGNTFPLRYRILDQQGLPVTGLTASDFPAAGVVLSNVSTATTLTQGVDYQLGALTEIGSGKYEQEITLLVGAAVAPGDLVDTSVQLTSATATDGQPVKGVGAFHLASGAGISTGEFKHVEVQPSAPVIADTDTTYTFKVKFLDTQQQAFAPVASSLNVISATNQTGGALAVWSLPANLNAVYDGVAGEYNVTLSALSGHTLGDRIYVTLRDQVTTVDGLHTRWVSFGLALEVSSVVPAPVHNAQYVDPEIIP
ncbi:MAG: hypothetical protein OEY97_09740 [Nitrospirota bacterium]|nr:hypothetical protein [Nitrospirota bacterium]